MSTTIITHGALRQAVRLTRSSKTSPVCSAARSNTRPSQGVFSQSMRSAQTLASDSYTNERYIRIVEVAPRDGLQNMPPPAIPTDVKKELVERLLASGIRNMEVGSFVRKERVPQMADSDRLLTLLPPSEGANDYTTMKVPQWDNSVHYPVLALNLKGLENLIQLEKQWKEKGGKYRLTDEIAVVVAATDEFSKANQGAGVDKVLAGVRDVVKRALDEGYRVRGYVSCVMTDPFVGPVQPEKVVRVAKELEQMGCYEISLGDTTGEGNPQAWKVLWKAMQDAGLPMEKVAAHCHDTFSMALSSILALLPMGLKSIDASVAGLGGCPYSPGATGNVATEDVVYALHKLGYQTGIDLDKLVETGNWLCETLGIRNESRVGRAMWSRRKLREKQAAASTP